MTIEEMEKFVHDTDEALGWLLDLTKWECNHRRNLDTDVVHEARKGVYSDLLRHFVELAKKRESQK